MMSSSSSLSSCSISSSSSSTSTLKPKPKPAPPLSTVTILPILNRPRVLYCSIHSWASVTGGRFLAPFLRHLGLSDTHIGMAFALQQIMLTLFSSFGGILADSLERNHPGVGRSQVLATGIIYATLVYLLNALEFQNPLCYVALAGLYTVGLALILPVLDGITIEYLERTSCREDFGRERLYGPIAWAFTTVYISLAFDLYGFDFAYPMAGYSCVVALLTVYIFSSGQEYELSNQTQPPSRHGIEANGVEAATATIHVGGTTADGDSHTETTRTTNSEGESDCTKSIGTMDSCTTSCSKSVTSVESYLSCWKELGFSERFERAMKLWDIPERDITPVAAVNAEHVQGRGIPMFHKTGESMLNGKDAEEHPRESSESVEREDQSNGTESTEREEDEGNNGRDESNERNSIEVYFEILGAMLSSCYGCAFMFFFTCLSAGQSVVDSLVFLYFESQGGSYLMMGYTVLITMVFELPIYYAAPQLLKRIGAHGLLIIAGVAYVARVVSYTFIPSSALWYILFLEPLHGITYAGTLTAVTDFAAAVIPKGYEATGQSVVYLMRGFGMGTGVLLGGRIHEIYGPLYLFRGAAMVVSFGLGSFVLALMLEGLFLGNDASPSTPTPPNSPPTATITTTTTDVNNTEKPSTRSDSDIKNTSSSSSHRHPKTHENYDVEKSLARTTPEELHDVNFATSYTI